MDFELSADHRLIKETFARFCDEQIMPNAAAIDEAHDYPYDLFRQLGDLGFFGMRYPEKVGGSDLDILALCLALTEVGARLDVACGLCRDAVADGHQLSPPARQ